MNDKLMMLEAKFGKLNQFPNANDLEKCIIILIMNHWKYDNIQKMLGSPPKKVIRQVIKKYIPEYLDNKVKKEYNNTSYDKRIIGLINKFDKDTFTIQEFGNCKFFIDSNQLLMKYTWDNIIYIDVFNDWDDRTKQSILLDVAHDLNIKIY